LFHASVFWLLIPCGAIPFCGWHDILLSWEGMLLRPRPAERAFQNHRPKSHYLFVLCVLGATFIFAPASSAEAQTEANSPKSLYRDADAAYDRGDVQQAIQLYEKLIKIDPDSVAARTNLGVALAHVGRYRDAITQYEEALNRAPDSLVVRLNLALAWYKQAEFEKAASELERVRASDKGNRQPLYLLADCYLRLGRSSDAVTLLQPIYDAGPDDRAVDFALGTALIRNGQIQQGQAIINRIMKTGNGDEVELLQGAAQLAAHDSKNAALTIHQALEANPGLPGGWSLYGRALLDSGNREGAKTAFQKALQGDANDYEANLYLGGMLRYDGNAAEAEPYLVKALSLRPNSAEARFQVGMLNMAKGKLEDALSEFEQVARQSPDFQEVHVQLALVYARLNRKSDSERERAIVVQLDEKARETAPRQSAP
jgi:Flp pilus assembly protein TadD